MIIHGDSLEVLKTLEPDSVDAVVTDPPYGWRFMGKAWDGADIVKHSIARVEERAGWEENGRKRKAAHGSIAQSAGEYNTSRDGNKAFELWTEAWAKEVFRVLKPGGHALIFCGPRTYHRMASGVEDAGFEIRDQLQWLFGSGFPKSHNIGNGFGTALKPANEPIVLARKPLSESTVAKNVLRWGTGALNIDASRIEGRADKPGSAPDTRSGNSTAMNEIHRVDFEPNTQGRWPANLLLDETAAILLGESARFFYVAKASKAERNRGLEGMPTSPLKQYEGRNLNPEGGIVGSDGSTRTGIREPVANHHPTVKPIRLMEYLCRLITPSGGTILDPFMGSGSTGVAAKNLGFEFIGIEMNEEYVEIAKKRIG